VPHRPLQGRSPTVTLLLGLIVTLAMVLAYSWYISRQIGGLRTLQTDLTDRNRRESLQLLRIQNDLNQLALAMRDMLDPEEAYPLIAWQSQFERIRADLDDAIARQGEVAVGRRTPEQSQYLAASVRQFWEAAQRIFELAEAGHEAEAREQIRLSLQARQAALGTTVARLLVQNNEIEAQTAERVQDIYAQVQRQVRWFLIATLVVIAATSLYLIRTNRRVFLAMASLSDQRQDLARQLITTREDTLRELSRELHDEFGQLLTAMGSMLGRLRRQVPEGSPLREDLREVAEVAQAALDNVRGLSQTLHPSILEELGLSSTVDWYLGTVPKQLGLTVHYDREGTADAHPEVAIHVYRVLQEAISNVARHSGAREAWVRLVAAAPALRLEVEDHGRGMPAGGAGRGLGLVAMRERASLIGGTLEFSQPAGGGTLVRLVVPLPGPGPAA
jgi:signal transduction histidine kinase